MYVYSWILQLNIYIDYFLYLLPPTDRFGWTKARAAAAAEPAGEASRGRSATRREKRNIFLEKLWEDPTTARDTYVTAPVARVNVAAKVLD